MFPFTATGDPQDVLALVSVSGIGGSLLWVQNSSTTATLLLRAATSKPAVGGEAVKVEAGGCVELPLLDKLWAWTADADACPAVLVVRER